MIKTKFKTIVTTAMAVALAVVLTGPISAKAYVNPGGGEKIRCGNNVEAIVNDGVITLKGSGATYDYTAAQFMADQVPFAAYNARGAKKNTIKKIVVEDGITHIGNLLFYYVNANTVQFGKNVETIGEYSFACNKFIEGVKIPANVKKIGKNAFLQCDALAKIDLGGSDKVVPNLIELGEYSFYGNKAKTVVIPVGIRNVVPESAFAKSGDSPSNFVLPELKWQTVVKLNANGGSCKQACVVRVSGEKYDWLPTPTKKGYTFAGWYYGSQKITENSKVSIYHETLEAKWSEGSKLSKPGISSLTSKSKAFKIKVKNIDEEATGYQIQYATDSDFDDFEQVSKKKSTKTATIKGLDGDTKYYVRVRAYKSEGGKKIYSKWSAVKTVTTKR